MQLFKRILVIDRPTQYSEEVLQHGIALAKTFRAELCVLRLVSNPVDMEAVNAPGLFIKGEMYKTYPTMKDQYAEDLQRIMRQAEIGHLPCQFVTDESPMEEIRRIVAEQGIDLIVTLAHEEGRLEHLLFGGEQRAMVRMLPCSVLLIKREPGPPLE